MSSDNNLFGEIVSNRKLLRFVISRVHNLRDYLGDPGGKHFLCPFHQDSVPSAVLHKDDDCDRLYCFSCRKQFTSYDYLTRVKEVNPVVILKNYSDQNKVKEAVIYYKNNKGDVVEKYEPNEGFWEANKKGLECLLDYIYLEDLNG